VHHVHRRGPASRQRAWIARDGKPFCRGLSRFRAQLTGAEEVPPNTSRAHGNVDVVVGDQGDSLEFKLRVGNIENVVAAHIHLGLPGMNGPVVAQLYGPVAPGGGRAPGRLADGTITAADLVGPLAGQPRSALLLEIQAGNAYVNVHTNDGVDPPNTGPGDLPGGQAP
jgi:hypothetical protein